MRKIFSICFLILSSQILTFGQFIGNVPLNKNFAATIAFNQKITSVIVGSLENASESFYSFTPRDPEKMKNMIVFSSANPASPNISLTIQLEDGSVYVGVLCYTDTIKKPYYKQFPENLTTIKKDTISLNIKKQESDISKKLTQVISQPPEIDLPAKRANRIIFSVENIVTDKEYTYLHISIDNRSSLNFEINGVVFKYIEGKVKSLKKDDIANREDVIPKFKTGTEQVFAHTKESLGFVLPLFSTSSKGYLSIDFIEKKGTRNTQITISADDLSKVKVMN